MTSSYLFSGSRTNAEATTPQVWLSQLSLSGSSEIRHLSHFDSGSCSKLISLSLQRVLRNEVPLNFRTPSHSANIQSLKTWLPDVHHSSAIYGYFSGKPASAILFSRLWQNLLVTKCLRKPPFFTVSRM